MSEAIKVKRKYLKNSESVQTVTLSPENNQRLVSFCGQNDEHLRLIESRLGVQIKQRGYLVHVSGNDDTVAQATKVIQMLYAETEITKELTPENVAAPGASFWQLGHQMWRRQAAAIIVFPAHALMSEPMSTHDESNGPEGYDVPAVEAWIAGQVSGLRVSAAGGGRAWALVAPRLRRRGS